MKIQDTAVWSDPVVQETLACLGDMGEIGDGGEDVNDTPIMKMLLQTECFDPLTIASVLADVPYMGDSLPPQVKEVVDFSRAERVRTEGPGHIFAAGNAAALKLVLAEFTSETTGEAFQTVLAQHRRDPAEIKAHIDCAADNLIAIADGLAESGLCRQMPPLLLDKFIESVENVATLVESRSRRKVMAEAVSGLKIEVARLAAKEIAETSCPPRIDPASKYEVQKNLAKTKFRLR